MLVRVQEGTEVRIKRLMHLFKLICDCEFLDDVFQMKVSRKAIMWLVQLEIVLLPPFLLLNHLLSCLFPSEFATAMTSMLLTINEPH